MMNNRRVVFRKKDHTLNNTIEGIINADYVHLDYGKWYINNMDELCPIIQEWKIKQLQIYKNQNKRIMREVQNIAFPKLKRIWFNSNQIQSIEGLSRIWVPTLQLLGLRDNNITSIREFRKLDLPYLKVIGIPMNKIIQAQSLTKMKAHEAIKQMVIDYNSVLSIEDMGILCKIQPTKIQKLYITNSNRMVQAKLKKLIKQKYKNVEIFEHTPGQ